MRDPDGFVIEVIQTPAAARMLLPGAVHGVGIGLTAEMTGDAFSCAGTGSGRARRLYFA